MATKTKRGNLNLIPIETVWSLSVKEPGGWQCCGEFADLDEAKEHADAWLEQGMDCNLEELDALITTEETE